jgi:hypothetical protein
MTKRYEFKFSDYECNDTDDDYLPYPVASTIDASFDFQGPVTWDVILWQFCKFLEATGYARVTDKVRLVDPYGMMRENHLFECITEDDVTMDWDNNDWSEYDPEEDEEETIKKEEVSFQDIKREIE